MRRATGVDVGDLMWVIGRAGAGLDNDAFCSFSATTAAADRGGDELEEPTGALVVAAVIVVAVDERASAEPVTGAEGVEAMRRHGNLAPPLAWAPFGVRTDCMEAREAVDRN